ncbi:DEAD-box ATP-dependent RNA helicase 47A-like [Planoprotostelium fungivorum]|uniref:DEAD-box ATP-dependent RNA helicase 47A-like n=1 Tax=Planoprotostelium fungivorum TaxID=1890364 RepID=A0A2P6MRS2_9EUKA|nr:DEAD-box ATP-dependent RNA helicase 47A-like [Planoprotostelium fungivorum]
MHRLRLLSTPTFHVDKNRFSTTRLYSTSAEDPRLKWIEKNRERGPTSLSKKLQQQAGAPLPPRGFNAIPEKNPVVDDFFVNPRLELERQRAAYISRRERREQAKLIDAEGLMTHFVPLPPPKATIRDIEGMDDTIDTFEGLDVPPSVIQLLSEKSILRPTPIQVHAIQRIHQGKDVIFQSQTGSGKTLAFLLPIVSRLIRGSSIHHNATSPIDIIKQNRKAKNRSRVQHLILLPTHELVIQTANVLEHMIGGHDESVFFVPPEDSAEMKRKIETERPAIILSTPKRIQSFLQAETGMNLLLQLESVVVDEADVAVQPLGRYADLKAKRNRILHKPPTESILRSISTISPSAQLVCASATINTRFRRFIKNIWRKDIEVVVPNIEESFSIPKSIRHDVYVMRECEYEDDGSRYMGEYERVGRLTPLERRRGELALVHFEQEKMKSALVIVEDSRDLNFMEYFKEEGIHAAVLIGTEPTETEETVDIQRKREEVISSFHTGELQILVATENGIRGLDLPLTNVMILLEAKIASSYIHMAGRCGRNGQKGRALSVLTEQEVFNFQKIASALAIDLNRVEQFPEESKITRNDNSLLCGNDLNNVTVVFSVTDDVVVQNLATDASRSIISGDGQWVVVVKNETINFYIRQARSWTLFTSTPIPFSQNSTFSLFFDTTGSRLVLATRKTRYFYSKSSTSKDYTLWSQLVPQFDITFIPKFSGDLSTVFEKRDSLLFASTVDWVNQKMGESTNVTVSVNDGSILATNSAGTAFVYSDHDGSRLYRKSSDGWIVTYVGLNLDRWSFSGDNQFLLRGSFDGELYKYFVGDLTRSYLPHQFLSSELGDDNWLIHSNYDGSGVVYNDSPAGENIKSVTPSTLWFTTPSHMYGAGEMCLNDTWCITSLTCGPGHYCHQLNRRAQPDTYDEVPMHFTMGYARKFNRLYKANRRTHHTANSSPVSFNSIVIYLLQQNIDLVEPSSQAKSVAVMDDDILTQFIHAKKNPGQSPILFSEDRQQIIKQLRSYRLKPIEAAESAVLGPNREILQRRVLVKQKHKMGYKNPNSKKKLDNGFDVLWLDVVPKSKVASVVRWLHLECGHAGINKIVKRAQAEKLWWPKSKEDLAQASVECANCAATRVDHRYRPPMKTIKITHRRERLVFDVTYLQARNKYLVTGVDAFTKKAWAYATALKDADAVIAFLESLGDESWAIYHTDNGKEFINKKVEEYVKSRTAVVVHTDGTIEEIAAKQVQGRPYHPQSQGHVEKFNGTIKDLIKGTKDWEEVLEEALRIYNSNYHATTNYSPEELDSMIPMPEEVRLFVADRIERKGRKNAVNKNKNFAPVVIKRGDRLVYREPYRKKKHDSTSPPRYAYSGIVVDVVEENVPNSTQKTTMMVKLCWETNGPNGQPKGTNSSWINVVFVKHAPSANEGVSETIGTLFAPPAVPIPQQQPLLCPDISIGIVPPSQPLTPRSGRNLVLSCLEPIGERVSRLQTRVNGITESSNEHAQLESQNETEEETMEDLHWHPSSPCSLVYSTPPSPIHESAPDNSVEIRGESVVDDDALSNDVVSPVREVSSPSIIEEIPSEGRKRPRQNVEEELPARKVSKRTVSVKKAAPVNKVGEITTAATPLRPSTIPTRTSSRGRSIVSPSKSPSPAKSRPLKHWSTLSRGGTE